MSITLTLDRDGFDSTVQHLLRNVEDLSPVSYEIGQLLSNSVKRNFTEGGKPEKWKQSKRAKNDGGQTLRDSGILMNSIVGGDAGDNRIRVGTNVEYAAAHNFGVDKEITQQVGEHIRRITQAFGKPLKEMKEVTVKKHSRSFHLKIEEREFMMVQDEDWEDITDIIALNLQKLLRSKRTQ